MRALIVGDVHGCYEELLELLDRAGLSDDEIVAVGDLVDRGPHPADVLRFFGLLPAPDGTPRRARSVMGNHERRHVRWAAGEVPPALSQQITRLQLGEAAWAEAVRRMAALPRLIARPDCIVVHGFWEPGVPPEAQRETVLCGTMSGADYIETHYERPTGRRWYELYDGPLPLVVGHLDYTGTGEPLVWRDRVFGLETGAAEGGWLTGLLVPDFRFVRVRARTDHRREVTARWAPTLLAGRPDERLTWEEAEALAAGAGRPDLPPDVRARAERVARAVARAETALAALRDALEAECRRVLDGLRTERPDWESLDERARESLFAARVGPTERGRLLRLARRGRLTPDVLRHKAGGPFGVEAFLQRLDLRPDDPAFYRDA